MSGKSSEFDKFYSSKSKEDGDIVGKISTVDSRVTVDKFEPKDDGKHVHHSYTHDRDSGSYREYRGGENSDDRSYNKSDSSKDSSKSDNNSNSKGSKDSDKKTDNSNSGEGSGK